MASDDLMRPGIHRLRTHQLGYSRISDVFARDGELSSRARSVGLYMLSHRDGFVLQQNSVAKALKISRNTLRGAFEDLSERGYMRSGVVREGSRVLGTWYLVHDEILTADEWDAAMDHAPDQGEPPERSDSERSDSEPGALCSDSEPSDFEPSGSDPYKGNHSKQCNQDPLKGNQTHTCTAGASHAHADRAGQPDDDPPWLPPLKDQDLKEQDHRNGQRHASDTGGVGGCEEPSADDLALRGAAVIAADEVWRELWELWPRKVAKKPAEAAWRAAVKTTDPNVILAAARLYVWARRGEDVQYVAHLRTWLTQGRWTDEPEPPRNGRRNGHQTFRSPGIDAYVGEL